MKIPEELLKKWWELRSHGDGKKIAEANKDKEVNEMDISRAMNEGKCPDQVFEVLAEFYKKKQEKVNEYIASHADIVTTGTTESSENNGEKAVKI